MKREAAKSKDVITLNRLSDLCLLCVAVERLIDFSTVDNSRSGPEDPKRAQAWELVQEAKRLTTFIQDLPGALEQHFAPLAETTPAFQDDLRRLRVAGGDVLDRMLRFGEFFRRTIAAAGSSLYVDELFTTAPSKAAARMIRQAARQDGLSAIRTLDAVPTLSGAKTIAAWIDRVAKALDASASEDDQAVRTVAQVAAAVDQAAAAQAIAAVQPEQSLASAEAHDARVDAQQAAAQVVASAPPHVAEVAARAAVAAQVASALSPVERIIAEARLSDEQEAVARAKGRNRVRAAAGSGKTHTVVTKIDLLVKSGVPPQNIVAVSFTRKAKGEIEDRLLKKGIEKVNVMTTDSFTYRLLFKNIPAAAQSAKKLGNLPTDIARGLKNIDNADALMKLAYKQIWMDPKPMNGDRAPNLMYDPANQWFNIGSELAAMGIEAEERALATAVGRVRAEGKSLAAMRNEMSHDTMGWGTAVTAMYGAYMWLKQYHPLMGPCLDFQDALSISVDMMQSDVRVRNSVQNHVKALFVDESQDLNDEQARLFLAVGGKAEYFDFVGDRNQSIYAFRGSNPDLFSKFVEMGFKDMTLGTNYRSGSEILQAANQLIAHNKGEHLECRAAPGAGMGGIEALMMKSHAAACEYVVDTIQAGIRQGRKASEFGVLTRTVAEQDDLLTKLMSKGIPFVSRFKYFNRRSVRALLSWMVLASPSGFSREMINDAVTDAGRLPDFGFGSSLRKDLDLVAQGNYLTYILGGGKLYPNATGDRRDYGKRRKNAALADMVQKIRKLQQESRGLSTSQIILNILELSYEGESFKQKLLAELEESTADDGTVVDKSTLTPEQLAQLDKDREAEALSPLQPMIDLAQETKDVGNFLANVQKLKAAEDKFGQKSDDKVDAVPVLTIHQWKGLEAPEVFVFAPAGVFPSIYASPESREMEEERRLFYVAITRGKDRVTVLCPLVNHRGKTGGASPFVGEGCIKVVPIVPTTTVEDLGPEEDMGGTRTASTLEEMIGLDSDELEFLASYEAIEEEV
jgi:DNA helicase-2/ATP-dependent DNA helicase PcrA